MQQWSCQRSCNNRTVFTGNASSNFTVREVRLLSNLPRTWRSHRLKLNPLIIGQKSNCQQQDITAPMLLCSWEPSTARQNTRHSFQAQDARSKILSLIFTQFYCLSSLSFTLRKWVIPRWKAIIFQRDLFLWKSDDRSFQLNRNKRLVQRAKDQVMIKQKILYFVKK